MDSYDNQQKNKVTHRVQQFPPLNSATVECTLRDGQRKQGCPYDRTHGNIIVTPFVIFFLIYHPQHPFPLSKRERREIDKSTGGRGKKDNIGVVKNVSHMCEKAVKRNRKGRMRESCKGVRESI